MTKELRYSAKGDGENEAKQCALSSFKTISARMPGFVSADNLESIARINYRHYDDMVVCDIIVNADDAHSITSDPESLARELIAIQYAVSDGTTA